MMKIIDPFARALVARQREWDSEIALGFRSSIPAIVAAHVGAICGHGTYPAWPRTKRPRGRGWQNAASCDPATIMRWHRAYEHPDFIIPTGRANGLWIIDVDGKRGRDRYAELVAKFGPPGRTVTTISGRTDGGFHLWFRPTPEGPDLKSVGKALLDGRRDCIDQKGRGGYAVLPGSLHASGARYRWAEGCAPDECELASLPDAWLEILDWADEPGVVRKAVMPSARRGSPVKRTHDPASQVIGDKDGGFNRPIHVRCCQFWARGGTDARAGEFKEVLRAVILNADASAHTPEQIARYASDTYLDAELASARNWIKSQAE